MSFVAGRHLPVLPCVSDPIVPCQADGTKHRVPTRRANARPMTGFAQQSRTGRKEWIASSLALLAMTSRHNLAISPRNWREFA
jgi:hypothetical protein